MSFTISFLLPFCFCLLASGSICFSTNSICHSICISPDASTVPLSIGNCPSRGRYGGGLENNSSFFFVSLSASFSIFLACFILFNEFYPSFLNKASTYLSFCFFIFSLFTVAFSCMFFLSEFPFPHTVLHQMSLPLAI